MSRRRKFADQPELEIDWLKRPSQQAAVISGYEPPASTASLKVNVIKNEEIDTAQYSPLASAAEPMVENLPAEKLDKLHYNERN